MQINETIVKGAKIELARRRFFFYCNVVMPSFYKIERDYLYNLCNELQNFLSDGEHDVLIINLPPYLQSFLKMFVIHFKKKKQTKIKLFTLIFSMLQSSMEMLQKTCGAYQTAITTIWLLLQQVLQQVSALTLLSLMMLSRMLRKPTMRLS